MVMGVWTSDVLLLCWTRPALPRPRLPLRYIITKSLIIPLRLTHVYFLTPHVPQVLLFVSVVVHKSSGHSAHPIFPETHARTQMDTCMCVCTSRGF